MLKKTILACVLLHLVVGTISPQKIDSIDIKSMRAYYKRYFNDPTDPIVLTASDTLFDMAIRCNDTVMAKIALGAKVDYYYYGQGENRTDSIIAGVNRLKQYARSVGNAELYYWAWAARLVNYYIIQGEYNIALLEAEKMLQEAKGEKKQGSIAECYYALANVYTAKGLVKKSQEFMLKEIDIFENANVFRYNISCQYSDAAKIYIDLGEAEKAPELLKKALKTSRSTYHEVTAKLVYVSLYLAQGDTAAARKALEECRQMYMGEPSMKRHIHYLYDVEIDYNWRVGNYNKALSVLDERETELRKKNNLTTLMALRKTKADILWDMNRKEEAAGLYRDFLLEQKKEKERNEEITTSEFATMLNLQQLNAEKVRLEKISQKKQLQNTRTILFSVLGLLCIVVIFLWQQRKLNAKLHRAKNKLDEQNRTYASIYKVVPGQEKLLDVNNDGTYNDDDQSIIGNGQPSFNWGWNNTLRYKDFDLSLFIIGFHGFDIYNVTDQSGYGNAVSGINTDVITPKRALLNRWTKENENTNIPGFVKLNQTTTGFNSRFVEKGDFIKVKSITLGYNLPKKACDKVFLNDLRLYFSVQNPFMITSYSGLDPEATLGSPLVSGVDWGCYPNSRNFLLGVNFSF